MACIVLNGFAYISLTSDAIDQKPSGNDSLDNYQQLLFTEIFYIPLSFHDNEFFCFREKYHGIFVSAQLLRNRLAKSTQFFKNDAAYSVVVHLIFCLHINYLICIIMACIVLNGVAYISLIRNAIDQKPSGNDRLDDYHQLFFHKHFIFRLVSMIMSSFVLGQKIMEISFPRNSSVTAWQNLLNCSKMMQYIV